MADANDDRRNTWIERGAKWGAIVGLLSGHLYVAANTVPSIGFYTGSAFMVFLVSTVLGVLIGGGIGTLIGMTPPADAAPPPDDRA